MCRFGQVNYTSQNSVRGGSGRSGGWVRVSRELRREARSVHTWDLLIRWPDSGACGLLPVPPAHPASGPGVHVQVHDKGLDRSSQGWHPRGSLDFSAAQLGTERPGLERRVGVRVFLCLELDRVWGFSLSFLLCLAWWPWRPPLKQPGVMRLLMNLADP